MGFGGTNFHVVLEEHDGQAGRAPSATCIAHGPGASVARARPRRPGRAAWPTAPSADGGPMPAEHARIGFVAADERPRSSPSCARWPPCAAARPSLRPTPGQHPKGICYRRAGLVPGRRGRRAVRRPGQPVRRTWAARPRSTSPRSGDAFDEANAVFAGRRDRLGRVVFPPPVFDPRTAPGAGGGAAADPSTRSRRSAPCPPGQFRFLRELGLRVRRASSATASAS